MRLPPAGTTILALNLGQAREKKTQVALNQMLERLMVVGTTLSQASMTLKVGRLDFHPATRSQSRAWLQSNVLRGAGSHKMYLQLESENFCGKPEASQQAAGQPHLRPAHEPDPTSQAALLAQLATDVRQPQAQRPDSMKMMAEAATGDGQEMSLCGQMPSHEMTQPSQDRCSLPSSLLGGLCGAAETGSPHIFHCFDSLKDSSGSDTDLKASK